MALMKARFRLMHKRWHSRRRRGFTYAVIGGMIGMLSRWAGYQGKFESWGYPIPFKEALPDFFIAAVIVFILFVFWPWRHPYGDES